MATERMDMYTTSLAMSANMLSNVWDNMRTYMELRQIKEREFFAQIAQLSGGKVKPYRIKRYDMKNPKRLKTDDLDQICFVALAMKVDPIQLMAGKIDPMKL